MKLVLRNKIHDSNSRHFFKPTANLCERYTPPKGLAQIIILSVTSTDRREPTYQSPITSITKIGF